MYQSACACLSREWVICVSSTAACDSLPVIAFGKLSTEADTAMCPRGCSDRNWSKFVWGSQNETKKTTPNLSCALYLRAATAPYRKMKSALLRDALGGVWGGVECARAAVVGRNDPRGVFVTSKLRASSKKNSQNIAKYLILRAGA